MLHGGRHSSGKKELLNDTNIPQHKGLKYRTTLYHPPFVLLIRIPSFAAYSIVFERPQFLWYDVTINNNKERQMAEVIRVYTQHLPEVKFVGKCYSEKDRINGTFAGKWEDWFRNNWFAPLKLDDDLADPFEDCDAFYGLCRCKKNEEFQYWIGVLMPTDAIVPQGYDSIILDEGEIAVCWVYGKEPDVYTVDSLESVEKSGYSWAADRNDTYFMFERYVCPRFTNPDEEGNIILDACYYIKSK